MDNRTLHAINSRLPFHVFSKLVFLFAVLIFPTHAFADFSLHHFDMSCDNCHQPDSQNQSDKIGKVKSDINQLCTQSGCHNYDAALNHPVGGQSQLTCLTCHDKGSDNNQRVLFKPEGMKFCGSCHNQISGNLKRQTHWQFSTRAHLGSINPASKSHLTEFVGGIDSESRTCLSCHSDISAVVPGINESTEQKKARWNNMTDHPIGVDYMQVASRNVISYNFPDFNNRHIRLFDGRLGCGSCHSLYTKTEKNLVMKADKGLLCRSCHNK